MEEGLDNQERCVQEDASEKRDKERTERATQTGTAADRAHKTRAKDALITSKNQSIPFAQSDPGVRVSLAMTHLRGRSCHREVKGRRRPKNGAEAGCPNGPRSYQQGPSDKR